MYFKQILNKQYFLGLLLLPLMFLLFASEVKANGPYGWFVPAAKYIDDSLPSQCNSSNETSVRVTMVEYNTENPISGLNGGNAGVSVLDANTSKENNWYPFNGNSTTDICFNPDTEILQAYLFNDSTYENYQGQKLQPSESYPSSMVGHRFQGYLQLVRHSAGMQPFSDPISPSGETFSAVPSTFKVGNNGVDNLYGAGSEVRKTRIYLINHDTKEMFTRVSNTDSSDSVNEIPAPVATSDGVYWWSVDHTMAGDFKIKPNKAGNIRFNSTPQSGNLVGGCFVVDSTLPQITIGEATVNCNGDGTVDLSFEVNANDNGAGLDYADIYIEEKGGALIKKVRINYPDPTSSDTRTLKVSGVPEDLDVVITAEVFDMVGNVVTSSVVEVNTTCSAPPTDPKTPIVIAHPTNPIGENTATLNCEVLDHGGTVIKKNGACWGEDPALAGATCPVVPVSGTGVGNFSVPLTGLTPNTDYYFQCYAENLTQKTGKSQIKSFTTNVSGAPDLEIYPATSIEQDKATLNADVIDDKGKPVTEKGFCWKEVAAATETCDVVTPPGTGPFSLNITGLQANTDYTYTAYAENENGKTVTDKMPFRTKGAPDVEVPSPEDVTSDSAKLLCEIVETGGVGITSQEICWDTDPAFSLTASDSGCANISPLPGEGIFDYQLPSGTLNPETTYYYRCAVENDLGLTDEDEGDFDTDAPGYPVVRVMPADNITNTTARIHGEVVDANGTLKERGFCWKRTLGGTLDCPIDPDKTEGAYSYDLTGLEPDTTYLFQAYAENEEKGKKETGFLQFKTNGGTDDYTPIDPNLSVDATPDIIRSGDETVLEWRMQNIQNDLTCSITGPSTFNGGNPYTFTHHYNPTAPSVITGTVDSGELFATQKFTFTCTSVEDPSEVYSADVTVRVIGDSSET